jgi:type I restriction enzyme S subunit
MSIPKLRFSEFSDKWKSNKLSKVAKVTSGGTPNRSEEKYWNGNIPWVSTSLINFNTIFSSEEYITKKGLENSSAKLFPIGTILLAMYGQGKTRGKVAILGIEASTNQACSAIIPNDTIHNNYLFQNLIGRYDEIRRLSNEGGQQNLSGSIIKDIPIRFPNLSEQKKIASFLSDVDDKITKLTKKKALLEQYKKGIMQKIFNQELRFKDDNGKEFPKWEVKKLGELLDYEQSTKYIVESTEYDNSFKTPVLTAGKSFLLGYTNETEGVYNKLPTIIFDDFTMANKYVDFEFKVKSSAMKILQPKTDEVNIKFVYEAIQMINYPKGDEHKRFWISEYSKIKIGYPCEKEQTKIANFLSDIDAKIEALNTKIEHSKTFKKGLLQQMFV